MQTSSLQIPLEFSALVIGFFFALFALIVISYYTLERKYRHWAFGQILFSIAFLWTMIFSGAPFFFGEFMTFLSRIFGSITILFAFRFRPIREIKIKTLHSRLLIIAILIWIPIGFGLIPSIFSATMSSSIMFLSFFITANLVAKTKNKTLIDYGTILAFMFWGLVSLPMILLPILPEVAIFGHLQFLGQTIVSLFMYVSFIRNMRVKLETQLGVSQLLRNIVAHDLRNYLNIISSAIDLAEAKDEASEKYLAIARGNVASASSFMMEIRDALLELSSTTLQFVNIDLNALIKSVVDRVQSEHNITKEQIDFSGIPDNFVVYSSPLLRQIIWNLLDNSVRYSIGAPMIGICVAMDNPPVLVISDRAGGIPDELKDALQLQSSGRNGLGVGLTIVKDLLEICDVQLDIVDVPDDNRVIGTSFQLTFNT